MAYCCPKSIRACAIRVTRLNASGVPLDPAAAESRILTSGFVELNLSPDYLSGDTTVTRDQCGNVALVDREFDVLMGFNLRLKLCGVPLPLLEMMIESEGLLDGLDTAGEVLKDSKRFACQDPLMVEVWSKNASGECLPGGLPGSGLWVHWVLPRTSGWELSSDFSFASGALEVELSGYGSQNPGWFPSNPDPARGAFPSYVAGWPTGPAPVVPNGAMSLDPWTVLDTDQIRDGGPLAWKCVDALPFPLDECGFVPAPEPPCDELTPTFTQNFVSGTPGPVPSPPWTILDAWGGALLPQLSPAGLVPLEDFQSGSVPDPTNGDGCDCPGNWLAVETQGVVRVTESGFVTSPVVHEYQRSGGASGYNLFGFGWDGANWTITMTGLDLTGGSPVTAGTIWSRTQTAVAATPPVNGDIYTLKVWQEPVSTLLAATYVVGYINNVEVVRAAFYYTSQIGAGYGWLFDNYAPNCYPTGEFGSPVSTTISAYITVTDNGGNSYTITIDDPAQAGLLSDPLGPVNNVGGALGQCYPAGPGGACATDPLQTPQTLQVVCVPDATTRTFWTWPSFVTVTGAGPSGTGFTVTTTGTLTDTALATAVPYSYGGAALGLEARTMLAQWVTDFGSGVPVEVKGASATAVECLANLFPMGSATAPQIRPGVFSVPDAFSPIPMSSVATFTTNCSAPPDGSYPGGTPAPSVLGG
jgi:hypothetical protein